MLTLQGCTSTHTLSPLTAVYTTCTWQPSSGSPTRVSAMAYLNTQVSSPGLSPIQVPSAGSPAEVSTTAPNDVCRVPGSPNGRLSTLGHAPTASQPTPRVSAAHGLQHTTNTRNYLQLLDRGHGRLISRESQLRIPMCGSSCSWITNTELSS